MSNSTADAKALVSELDTLDLSNPNSRRDAINKAQSLINTLQDPAEMAMENLSSVSAHYI